LFAIDRFLLNAILKKAHGLPYDWGIDYGDGVTVGADANNASADEKKEETTAQPVAEKTEFIIKLTKVDPAAKIKVIKEVRAITGLGLKEAKELVEKAPCEVKGGLPKSEAEALAKTLKAAGAEVDIA